MNTIYVKAEDFWHCLQKPDECSDIFVPTSDSVGNNTVCSLYSFVTLLFSATAQFTGGIVSDQSWRGAEFLKVSCRASHSIMEVGFVPEHLGVGFNAASGPQFLKKF